MTARMLAIPAIDLREGACVQLVGGSYEQEKIRLPDPVAVAEHWRARGFAELHLVDLDAATGAGTGNGPAIAAIADRSSSQRLQVGGGVRDEARLEQLFALGVERVVLGTKAIDDGAWLDRMAAAYPGRLVVAADVRGREVMTRGWSHRSGLTLAELLARLELLPLAAVLVTAIHVEGKQEGPDLALVREAVRSTRHPIQASGGISSLADLEALAQVGASRAVIGMAFYTGLLDPETIAKEYGGAA